MLFYGEPGSGRKLMAKYYTELLLCQNPTDGKPCGVCSACRNIDKGMHPDVKYAETSGKLGGYSVETARQICADAFVMPNNNSCRKVYIFRDCRHMDPRTQNTLLKIIEEPPDYAYFIFTSESKADFLPTIISRCVCFGLCLCTEDETRSALAAEGFGNDDIELAVSRFHGNIGKCQEYLSGGSLREAADLTKRIADSIINKDEYELNRLLASVGRERSDVKNVLSLMDKLVRDAAVLEEDRNCADIGCCRGEALRLSGTITVYQAERLHNIIEKAWRAVECNVGIPLVTAALSSEIIETL